jgi:hypothetical protein
MGNIICSLAKKSGQNVLNNTPNFQQHSNTAQISTSKMFCLLMINKVVLTE